MFDQRPILPRILRHAFLLGLTALLALALRRGLFLLTHPLPLSLSLLWIALLALAAALSLRGTEALYLPERHVPRMLWLVPLANFALLFGGLFVALWIPWHSGRPDFWKDLLDLPPYPLTHLVVLLFLLAMTHALLLFFGLTRSYLSERTEGRLVHGSSDRITSLAAMAMLGLFACLALYWRLAIPDNLRFFEAWRTLKIAHRPRDAVEQLQTLVKRHPDSKLRDNCLYRIARILEEDLSSPTEAMEQYERLLNETPDSPWCDDALLALARLRSEAAATRPEAIRDLLRFARRFPDSHLADDAALLLGMCFERQGNVEEARRTYGRIMECYPNRIWYDEHPAAYPFNLRRVRERAQRRLQALDEESRPSPGA